MPTLPGNTKSIPTLNDQFSDFRGPPTQADLRDLIATLGTRGVLSTVVGDNGRQLTPASGFIKCDASGGAYAMNLPDAVASAGVLFWFKKMDATVNVVTLNRINAQTIDGAASVALAAVQFTTLRLYSDGANWNVV